MSIPPTPQKVRKAIFPVGGLGTRFLPATKSMPKEMLPVVDKPLIHYAFEEAQAAGIEQFIFVTGRNKHAIEDHFDHVAELQTHLRVNEKRRELDRISDWLPPAGSISFTRQQQPRGLGHAVWCARHLIGDEPFAVILADDMVHSATPCLKQMVDAHAQCGGNMLGVMEVPRAQTSSYGIVAHDGQAPAAQPRVIKAQGLVEKPAPEAAPSTTSIIGRYILQPEIFAILDQQRPGAGGEIQLTDAIHQLIATQNVFGYHFEGVRYDCGSLVGFVAANLAYALARDDIGTSVQDALQQVLSHAAKSA